MQLALSRTDNTSIWQCNIFEEETLDIIFATIKTSMKLKQVHIGLFQSLLSHVL